MIKSPQVASELDRRYQVSRRLFAESWDGERQVWRAPRTVKIFLKSIMYGLFGLPAWAPPDAMQLSGYLGNQIQVVPDGINVYQISYSYTDPKFAQWFLGAVVQLADARTLQVTKNTTKSQLRHLRESLDSTASVEFRQAIVGAFVNKQYQSLMAVEGQPFALTILSSSSVSSQPVSPKPPLFIVAGAILGALAGVVLLFTRRMLFRI
jgi:hypothetical protein